MAYRTKKEVLDSIKERETTKANGAKYTVYTAFLGRDPITQVKRRVSKSSREELEKYIADFFKQLNKGGDSAVLLTPYQSMDAKQAYDLIEQHKLALTLTDCVYRLIDGATARPFTANEETLGNAFRAYLASFEEGLHRKSVNSRVGIWVQAFGGDRKVSEVTAPDVAAFLKEHCVAPKTYNNYLQYIKTFMNWCTKKERGYIRDNPLSDMQTQHIAYKEPEYMMPDAVAKLATELDGANLAYFILSFFCGVRREEILRMAELDDAAKFNLEDETVRISKPKGYTKGICPRAFHILPNALAWMKSFDFVANVKGITEKTTRNISDIAKRIGVKFPKNAGRHTFITMHCAAYGDPTKTEAIVGTSKKMRVSNYCGLASKKDGEAYFAIYPSKVNNAG